MKQKCKFDYELERQKLADEMFELLADKEKFVAKAQALIIRSRQLKKLPALNITHTVLYRYRLTLV